MADAASQKKWRDKNLLVKRQLNIMARKQIHDAFAEMAESFGLRGKGEAVTFACFVARALIQRADYDLDAARMLDDFAAGYHRDRDIHSA
jgi:hypothetical protein